MPRIRSVHPDICVSDTMAQLPARLERTFVRLWTHCDDEGRCEDRPRIIKAALYPLHDDITFETVDRELDELESAGLLRRYEVNGSRLIQVVSWSEYQKPQKPRPSQYPAPPVPVAETSRNDTRTLPEGYASGEGVGEGVGVRRGSRSIAPSARKRNPVWDALSEVFGEPETETARSLRGKVTRSLTAAEASFDEILRRVEMWPHLYPDATLTDVALEKHWTALGRPPLRATSEDVERHKRDLELQAAQEEYERAQQRGIGR